MKERTILRYACEICGAEYENKDECLACENGHITKGKIKSMSFEAKKKIPYMVWLELEDQTLPYMVCPGRD